MLSVKILQKAPTCSSGDEQTFPWVSETLLPAKCSLISYDGAQEHCENSMCEWF